MPIKFECACGNRVKAPDGSGGRRVRCPRCRAAVVVPGPATGGADLGTGVREALAWQDGVRERRSAPAARWLGPATERWLSEQNPWVLAGATTAAAFGTAALAGYAAGFLAPLPFCAFMVLVGVGGVWYGRHEEG